MTEADEERFAREISHLAGEGGRSMPRGSTWSSLRTSARRLFRALRSSTPSAPSFGRLALALVITSYLAGCSGTASAPAAPAPADLERMYSAARERGLGVVALTVAPWGGFARRYRPHRGETTRELNDWIRAARERGSVDHVVDAYALLSCGHPERLCDAYMRPFRDGLHFGARGHEVLGEALHRDVFSDCR